MEKEQKRKGLKSGFTSNSKWNTESAKIRKTQISLDFPDEADTLLRMLAVKQHKAPSSLVREILGMPNSPPKRVRVGVSFNDEEILELSKRYSVGAQNRAEIRRRMTEEVVSLLEEAEEKKVRLSSDIIHKRFVDMLEKRNSKEGNS